MLTPSDYLTLFNSCVLTSDPHKLKEIEFIKSVALKNQSTYAVVSAIVTTPWPVIAAIHFRESNQSLNCHLHNGDPLSAKTVHVPPDRPTIGEPPFTWAESACDALSNVWRPHGWDIASCLQFIERYNGLGYQKHGINTPYLWDYTDKYESGLFVSDGRFDPSAMESRPGAVAILKSLNFLGQIDNVGLH